MQIFNRWAILALLFAVRLSMAFQFQSVASVSPLLTAKYGVTLGEIGLLIGLYLAPGLAFALPGGEVARRFGDKQVVLVGLGLMIAGGLIMTAGSTWTLQISGRIVACAGGVFLNVVMSKMVTDWFSGKELATAMAIFVNSWPVGIALCLVVLPVIAAERGAAAAFLISSAFCVLGFLLLATLYKPMPQARPGQVAALATWPAASAIKSVVVAGIMWGFFNAAISMVFGFGPSMLAERGWSLSSAGSATSVVLWLVGVSVPLGGIIADRINRPVGVMISGFMLFAVSLLVATRTDATILAFVLLGLVAGLSAGPILSLPARVLPPPVRAVGMGIFFTLFYLIVVLAPIAAGSLATRVGTASVAFDFGAVLLVLCVPAYFIFDRLALCVSDDHPVSSGLTQEQIRL